MFRCICSQTKEAVSSVEMGLCTDFQTFSHSIGVWSFSIHLADEWGSR